MIEEYSFVWISKDKKWKELLNISKFTDKISIFCYEDKELQEETCIYWYDDKIEFDWYVSSRFKNIFDELKKIKNLKPEFVVKYLITVGYLDETRY